MTRMPMSEELQALKKALNDALGELRVVRSERDLLKEQLNRFKRQLFDAKSEVSAAHQKDLFFNEAEVEGAQAQPAAADTEGEKVEVPAHQRTKRGRKPLDPALPRDVRRHELPEDERVLLIVAMESTGVYWIPLYDLLERRGFEVMLVDARHVKGVHGRKSDVLDCQWLQQLLSYGLLRAAFRPHDQFCALRELTRIRSRTLRDQGRIVQHMQKAMTLMNMQLGQAISDVAGVTGQKIGRAIVAGERARRSWRRTVTGVSRPARKR